MPHVAMYKGETDSDPDGSYSSYALLSRIKKKDTSKYTFTVARFLLESDLKNARRVKIFTDFRYERRVKIFTSIAILLKFLRMLTSKC